MQMVRSLFAVLAAFAMTGCATEPMLISPSASPEPRTVPPPATAALAFTPPAARDIADGLNLDRDGRGAFATAGFEDVVISETYVRQDDQQRFNHFGDFGEFDRRAVSTTVTVRQK